MFDTGSANSWVLSTEAASNMSEKTKEQHYFYDKNSSETYDEPDIKEWVKINFGSGHLKGFFVHDKCTLGDLDDPSNQLVLDNYMFGMVT